MIIKKIDETSGSLPTSNDFIVEGIRSYINQTNFPKQLQLKKIQLMIENNKRIENDIVKKVNEFNKAVIDMSKKKQAHANQNIMTLQKLQAIISKSV